MSSEPLDLSLIGRQQKDILDELRLLRDDRNVTAAIVQRMDGTLSRLVSEIRATHSQ